jgi:hypothetical protein
VKLAVVAVVGIGLAVLAGLWAGRRFPDPPRAEPGVEANGRLTGYAAVVLPIPQAAKVVTGARPGLVAHAMIGSSWCRPCCSAGQRRLPVPAGLGQSARPRV